MKAHLIKLESEKELAQAALRLGASEASLRFFEARRETLQIYVTDVPSPAASIIKQEMLSRGGDAAVHANVINCGVERSDVIIFGTAKQLGHLADKLELMPWWKLSELAAEIRRLTATRAKRAVKLPCGAELAFGERMLLMGIINLTDDSFFGGSRCYGDADKAVTKAVKMAEEGADILDLGAESTRPGAPRVPEEQERERMSAAVAAIRRELPRMPLSIDTTRASVAEAALENGADVVNDVSGLQFDNGIAEAAARHRAMLVLMHMRGTPETMRTMCGYNNLISEVCAFLEEAADKAVSLGVSRESIIIDPGIGFAKDHGQNLFLLRHCESFKALGYPLLIGASRKGCVGAATGREAPEERLYGTLAVTALCCRQGADIIRVHDVRENKDVIKMTEAIQGAEYV